MKITEKLEICRKNMEPLYYLPKFHFGKVVRLTVCLIVCLFGMLHNISWTLLYMTNQIDPLMYHGIRI